MYLFRLLCGLCGVASFQRPAARGQRLAASGQRPAASGSRPAARGQRPADDRPIVTIARANYFGCFLKKPICALLHAPRMVSFNSEGNNDKGRNNDRFHQQNDCFSPPDPYLPLGRIATVDRGCDGCDGYAVLDGFHESNTMTKCNGPFDRYEYTACINLDVFACELAESWVNGNRSMVVRILQNDHPGLLGLLLTQYGPGGDGILSQSDCNHIANRVLDNRAERCM
jgi:hypothetical protein